MNIFVKILLFFYSVWNVISFMTLTIPMMIGYILLKLVPYPKQIVGVFFINRTALFIWSILVGMRYKIRGLENVKKGQTYIVVVNHVNAADMMAIAYGARICKTADQKRTDLYSGTWTNVYLNVFACGQKQ